MASALTAASILNFTSPLESVFAPIQPIALAAVFPLKLSQTQAPAPTEVFCVHVTPAGGVTFGVLIWMVVFGAEKLTSPSAKVWSGLLTLKAPIPPDVLQTSLASPDWHRQPTTVEVPHGGST
ncbi:unannotated protein [freshwater metagenome]|uniref:Unannotated protein n=1 Tax=freshwater metagenome TaxID=449393 RepID=A0A6J6TTA8_9ZZZZ